MAETLCLKCVGRNVESAVVERASEALFACACARCGQTVYLVGPRVVSHAV